MFKLMGKELNAILWFAPAKSAFENVCSIYMYLLTLLTNLTEMANSVDSDRSNLNWVYTV